MYEANHFEIQIVPCHLYTKTDIMLVEIVIFILTFLFVYFWYCRKRVHDNYKKNDVKFIPGYLVYGNTYSSMKERKHMSEEIIEVYNAFPGERYVGFMEGTNPIMIIRDPELIKSITVKYFDHFMDHKEFFPSEEDIFGKSMFVMKGNTWRDMRTTLSPAFTGSKMRLMMPAMVDVSQNVVEYLKDNPGLIIDVDDLMRRYSNDVIASAGFGLQVNSFKDRWNEFYRIGQSLFRFTLKQKLVMFLFLNAPSITKYFKMMLFPIETVNFFRNMVVDTMEYREKHKIERPDMIQLLMEASKGTLSSTTSSDDGDVGFATTEEMLKPQGEQRKWTLDELVGQVFLFFTAGFETSASTLVMAVHELALNPAFQVKLYDELKAFSETKEMTFDNIGHLKYLDCVVNETLRRWSAAIFMDRMCVKTFDLPPPREGAKPVRLNPGDVLYNMVNAIHLDPQYHPNPEIFDPERFSDENKHKIAPFTFMPFGMGPRNCIGSRFAILELKVLLYHLVLNFKIVRCEKTMDPIKLLPMGFTIKAASGTFVKFESRV